MLFYITICQESKLWVFENNTNNSENENENKTIMPMVFFRSTRLCKAIKSEGQKTVPGKLYTTESNSDIL